MKAPFKIGYIDTVHGICPQCQEDTLLVAVVSDYYKYLKLDETDREWLKRNHSSE